MVTPDLIGISKGRDPISRLMQTHLVNQDPPAHTRLRGLINKGFTPQIVELQRAGIRSVCEALIGAAKPRGEMELIGDFAFQLPITVICNMLGIPSEDMPRFSRWSKSFVASIRTVNDPHHTRVLAEFVRYLRVLFAQRRAAPGDGLIDRLLAQSREGVAGSCALESEGLSEDELYGMVMFLIVAGHETTQAAIGNALVALLQSPEDFASLRCDPGLMPGAVEELLRYDSPVERPAARWALGDVEIGGQVLRKGESVIPVINAANRDPRRFDNPDSIDLRRDPNPHLAFAQGIHFCLGAALARMELTIGLEILLAELPGLRLAVPAQTLEIPPGELVRSYARVPLKWDP